MGSLVTLGYGWPGSAVLTAFFVLSVAATRWRRRRAPTRPSDGGEGGRRGLPSVVANGAVVAVAAALAAAELAPRVCAIAGVAALTEAAADTVGGELGRAAAGATVRVTTWKPVPPGTDGGVSAFGTLATALAATVVSATAVAAGLVELSAWGPVAVCGFGGAVLDSVLGATVEERGWLGNEAVNLSGTLAAALGAIAWQLS